ncbi:MAG: hypothetical protein H8E37_04720 [Planctomycetes bacterium]|nr:hypothetical protein [Planctomycetota bacterium]
MTTNPSRIVALLFIASFPLPTIAQESPAPKVFATPESVVAAYRRAKQQKDDFAEYRRRSTSRYREVETLSAVFLVVVVMAKDDELQTKLQSIIKRHCPDIESLKHLRENFRDLDPDDPEVEDKLLALHRELLECLKRNEVNSEYLISEIAIECGTTCRNYRVVKQSIKTDGDTARVRIHSEHEEAQKTDGKTIWKTVGGLTLLFLRKTENGWRIDLDDDQLERFERIRNPNKPKSK